MIRDNYNVSPEWPVGYSSLDIYDQKTPGPLTISLLAMFDDSSIYQTAASVTSDTEARLVLPILCARGLPFNVFPSDKADGFAVVMSRCADLTKPASNITKLDIDGLVYKWLSAWNNTTQLTQALTAGNYFANKALFTKAVDQPNAKGSRLISSAAGTMVSKPDVSLAVKIVISLILAVQIFFLLSLAGFIYSSKQWGRRLMPLMILLIGERLEDTTPDLRLKPINPFR
jgi:hypothetical protein